MVDVYRTSLRIGFEEGIRRVLGVSTDSLSKDWISATRRAYLPALEGKTRPNQAGDPILQIDRKSGEMNLAPQVSPDGKLVALFERRGLFEIELFVADAQTGRVIKKLAGPTSNSHFDAITFISSSGAWSPDNQKFAFIAQSEGNHEIAILDVNIRFYRAPVFASLACRRHLEHRQWFAGWKDDRVFGTEGRLG